MRRSKRLVTVPIPVHRRVLAFALPKVYGEAPENDGFGSVGSRSSDALVDYRVANSSRKSAQCCIIWRRSVMYSVR